MQSQKQFKRRFSFEFFPPKTDLGKEKLQNVRNQLAEVNPDFFSVTFGAGGSTRAHLGILTREYGVPCVMNAKISGIKQGDTVRIECTGDPKTAADYQKNVERTVKVWRVASAG